STAQIAEVAQQAVEDGEIMSRFARLEDFLRLALKGERPRRSEAARGRRRREMRVDATDPVLSIDAPAAAPSTERTQRGDCSRRTRNQCDERDEDRMHSVRDEYVMLLLLPSALRTYGRSAAMASNYCSSLRRFAPTVGVPR